MCKANHKNYKKYCQLIVKAVLTTYYSLLCVRVCVCACDVDVDSTADFGELGSASSFTPRSVESKMSGFCRSKITTNIISMSYVLVPRQPTLVKINTLAAKSAKHLLRPNNKPTFCRT